MSRATTILKFRIARPSTVESMVPMPANTISRPATSGKPLPHQEQQATDRDLLDDFHPVPLPGGPIEKSMSCRESLHEELA